MPAMALPDQPLLADPTVDTPGTRSISFGASTGSRGRIGQREPVPVGPGRTASTPTVSFPIGGEVVHEFPLQPAKVQRPPLRREVLRRERLLDWLKVKIHHRVLLVIAEAGYGKTTLLADFARHHRRPTMWYRLDEEDRNWVSFLHYLVAAGREIEPDFAPATKGLLAELGVATGPSRDAIIATFLRELQGLGQRGATLIIDDYHLVDDVPDVRVLVRELVGRSPERLTIAFVSRQQPTLPLARLRTLGEVAELTAADLRFDLGETERLFRDTYKRPLEPDVLADLADRTEGWAASLEMVNAALRDRSPVEVRAFVHGMTGAHGELYDYLAEEVVGDLDDETQRFLMTTSLLQAVDPTLAEVVGGFPSTRTKELIAAVERLGLLSTRGSGRRGARRYHPLVREFLESRLRRTLGDDTARDLHRAVARHAGTADWRLAAYHFAAADDMADLGVVVQTAVPTIMGSGEFALAESYVQRAGPENNAAYELFVSRMELQRGRVDAALHHAELAVDSAMKSDDDVLVDHSLLNLVAVRHTTGPLEVSRDVAQVLASRTSSEMLRAIAAAVEAIDGISVDGNLPEARDLLVALAGTQEQSGLRHYVGVTWLNISEIDCATGDAPAALTASNRAIENLSASSAGLELEGANALRGWALALLGQWNDAVAEFRLAESRQFEAVRSETLSFMSEAYAWLGDRSTGEAMLERAREERFISSSTADHFRLVSALFALRRRDFETAAVALNGVEIDRPHAFAAFQTRVRVAQARLAVEAGASDAERRVAAALHLAARQGADLYASSARLLQAALRGNGAFSAAVQRAATASPASLALVAEVISERLAVMHPEAVSVVAADAVLRPERWREPLRTSLAVGEAQSRFAAGSILDVVGERHDIGPLRRAARELKGIQGASNLGRGLARRLATRVLVEDQGRVQIRLGDELIPGTEVRRKVLALLCFLLSRPEMSSTRDQVLEALWPDLEPEVGVNSLNQTMYFLRRVFEPAFSEETSPGYVHHDSDVLWLDPELVDSRSRRARAAIRAAERESSPENVDALSEAYVGRFALDFAYEDWAGPYRDSMHAAYLEIIEKAIAADTHAGAFDRAITLARRAMEADPDAEQIELSLLLLYRRTGAHSAAAEQYAHYAAMLRNDLGIEPPPLESL
jgi:ATP/maltotriose-dependent transcriptional regulator MalT/DNA-binding SARP family transcriptional activator